MLAVLNKFVTTKFVEEECSPVVTGWVAVRKRWKTTCRVNFQGPHRLTQRQNKKERLQE